MKYLTRKKIEQSLYYPIPKLIYGRITKDECDIRDLYTWTRYHTNRFPFKFDWQGWMLLKEYCYLRYNPQRIIQHPIYEIIGESITHMQIRETILVSENSFENEIIIHPYMPKSEIIGNVIDPGFDGLIWDFRYIDYNKKRLWELRKLFDNNFNLKNYV